MIGLFTDFGVSDIYLGQVKASIKSCAPSVDIIDVAHDVPDFSIVPAAHLLASLIKYYPSSVFLCVVDPGVGTDRKALVLLADGVWFVAPDNGLLSIVAHRAHNVRYWHIMWPLDEVSVSFHGRDLFAPLAAKIAMGHVPYPNMIDIERPDSLLSPADLHEIIYIDHYGNAITGIRSGQLSRKCLLKVNGVWIKYARVFGEVEVGDFFWYENSIGLIELAVNGGSAASALELKVGQTVEVVML